MTFSIKKPVTKLRFLFNFKMKLESFFDFIMIICYYLAFILFIYLIFEHFYAELVDICSFTFKILALV